MKKALLIFLFQWFGLSAWGQTIEWAKSFDLGIPAYQNEYVDQIVQLEDSSYLALARISKFGYVNQTFGRIYGLGLVRIDKYGDSVYTKSLNVTGWDNNYLAKAENGTVLVAFTMLEDTVLNAKMRIHKTDYSGNLVWAYPFIGPEWQDAFIRKVIPSREGGCFAVGSAKSIFPGNYWDGFLAKINPFGQLDFVLRYTNAPTTNLNNIEAMPDGNYLLSGTAFNRIWSCVVDSTGFQLSDKTWFKGDGVMGGQIKLGHGSQISYGYGKNSDNRGNIIKYDSSGDSVWVKRNTLAGFEPFISRDGGYCRYEGYFMGKFYLDKYDADSSMLWRVQVSDFNNSLIDLNCMAFDGLGSAVLAGSIKNPSPNRDDMYFIKVTNVGYPVNPLSTKPSVENPSGKVSELMAYPNPAQRYFYMQGIKSRTKLGLYNLQGHLQKEYTIQPNDAIPVWQLPTGLYIWKAEDGKRVWSGKILKEE